MFIESEASGVTAFTFRSVEQFVDPLDFVVYKAGGVDRTWGSSCAFAFFDCQATVENSGSMDGKALSLF